MVTLKTSVFPIQGIKCMADRPEQLLFLCYYDPYGISTVPETVAYIQSFSSFPITVINLFEYSPNGRMSLPGVLNLSAFSGIVVHNSLAYNFQNLETLDIHLKQSFAEFAGVKVLMKQDENFHFIELAKYIGRTGFDLIFTCLPEEAIPRVYPPELAGSPKFKRMLTGYVTPNLRKIDATDHARSIDIGYRGSIQPLSFGMLAYEKRKIGYDVERRLKERGLHLDISSRWEERLSGHSWLSFLAQCKATLGAESGASIFDFSGDLSRRLAEIEREIGPECDSEEYALKYLSKLSPLESDFYNQISPRHFEAAATRTLQILYPGKYSGIFVPGKHFFELSRDYSNLDDAVELLLDEPRRKKMVDTAYHDIIENEKYWIESFVRNFDEEILAVMAAKGMASECVYESEVKSKNILLMASHRPHLDPRLDWTAKCAPDVLNIVQLGINDKGGNAENVQRQFSEGVLECAGETWTKQECHLWYPWVAHSIGGCAALNELRTMEDLLYMADDTFSYTMGMQCQKSLMRFKNYIRHFLKCARTLVRRAVKIKGLHAIIATDLDTLIPGLIVASAMRIPIFYDAHEYWPEADTGSYEFEKQFWENMERRLVAHVDYCQTVSSLLAVHMSNVYGKSFAVLPNCEPFAASNIFEGTDTFARDKDTCDFIFQGGFSPHRGIELLIDAWKDTPRQAVLHLRGVDNEFKSYCKKLAERTGLLNQRIFFPAPVTESRLVSSLQGYDVGIIPYTPTGLNYSNCCPNKLSQYMAAKLPILANNTLFVDEILSQADCGVVVDFKKMQKLVKAVTDLAGNQSRRREMGCNGYNFFRRSFNWEVRSRDFYDAIISKTSLAPSSLRQFAGRKERKFFRETTASAIVQWVLIPMRALLYRIWICFPKSVRYKIRPYAHKIMTVVKI